jgi:4'-phosphopantetheinyl transferase
VLDFPPTPPGAPSPRAAGTDLAGSVVILLIDRTATRGGDHRILADLVARLTGVDPANVTLRQRCPTCREPGHGPIRVSIAAEPGVPTVHVSLARADGTLAMAVTMAGPVGIDLEAITALRRAPVAGALLSSAEARALAGLDPAALDAAVGALWTGKEAVLKAAGVGLRVDPRDLTITLDTGVSPVTGQPVLAAWADAPFPPDRVHLLPLTASAGLVGTVAVVGALRPRPVYLSSAAPD